MDILYHLKERLRFIERFYARASQPFVDTMGKIESEKDAFAAPPFDPERDDPGEPPFQSEWEDADDGLNLVGQAAISLVQTSLRQYLDDFIWLSRRGKPSGKGNWFSKYKRFFKDIFKINWEEAPVPLRQIEELNLMRNDSQHPSRDAERGMDRRLSEEHFRRFPNGLFAHEIDVRLSRGQRGPLPRVQVTAHNLAEAVSRVERFCEFLDQRRNWPAGADLAV